MCVHMCSMHIAHSLSRVSTHCGRGDMVAGACPGDYSHCNGQGSQPRTFKECPLLTHSETLLPNDPTTSQKSAQKSRGTTIQRRIWAGNRDTSQIQIRIPSQLTKYLKPGQVGALTLQMGIWEET